MLIQFRVRNFRSLKEEQELSLVASSLKGLPEAVTQVNGLHLGLLRLAAIYGANASGKTNVLAALDHMSNAVRDSQMYWPPGGAIPRDPFLLDRQSKDDSSSFEVDLLLEGARFHYGFSLNDREVAEEWLDAFPLGNKPVKKQMWFRREAKTFTFGRKLVGDNRAIERLTRPNSLFLSAAAQNNHEALLPIYRWFERRLMHTPRQRGVMHMFTAKLCQEESFKSALENVLAAADLGIEGLAVREEDAFGGLPPKMVPARARADIGKMHEAMRKAYAGEKDGGKLEKQVLALTHKVSAQAGVTLEWHDESAGTLEFLGLLGPVLRAIGSGGTLCVDELDASLHPLLALNVVSLFNNPKTNPRHAQMIFTTHDTNLLDKEILRRDQVWFTEKDAEGGTHLYPLTDFKPRKNESLERGYLQGRYGAVPFIGSTDFLADFCLDKEDP
jgi:hypothetical protein